MAELGDVAMAAPAPTTSGGNEGAYAAVMNTSRCTEDQARTALDAAGGDVHQAVALLQQNSGASGGGRKRKSAQKFDPTPPEVKKRPKKKKASARKKAPAKDAAKGKGTAKLVLSKPAAGAPEGVAAVPAGAPGSATSTSSSTAKASASASGEIREISIPAQLAAAAALPLSHIRKIVTTDTNVRQVCSLSASGPGNKPAASALVLTHWFVRARLSPRPWL